MNFDDIKDQLLSIWRRILERIQDTPTYTQLKDRFDVLSPRGQKLVVLGGVMIVFAFALILPLSWLSEASDTVSAFEDRRSIVRELLKVSREASEVPNIPMAPPISALKLEVESRVKEANLIDGQLKSVDQVEAPSSLIPADKSAGTVMVSVEKINLRQLIQMGTRLTQISPSVKMTDLEIVANREDAHYFDVIFRLTALAVPDLSTPMAADPEAPAPNNKKTNKNNSKNKKGSDE